MQMHFQATAVLFAQAGQYTRISNLDERARLADFIESGLALRPATLAIAAEMFLPMMQRAS